MNRTEFKAMWKVMRLEARIRAKDGLEARTIVNGIRIVAYGKRGAFATGYAEASRHLSGHGLPGLGAYLVSYRPDHATPDCRRDRIALSRLYPSVPLPR